MPIPWLISEAAQWTLPSSFGPAGLPKLGVEHYFFEIFFIQVRRGAYNRIRA